MESFGILCLRLFKCRGRNNVNIITGSVSPFFAVGIALFLANVIINIAVSKKFKNKKATDPSMEEAIEKELRELREKDSEPVAE